MEKRKITRSVALVGCGLAIGLLVGVGMMVGTWFGMSGEKAAAEAEPELVIQAAGADSCTTMAVTTAMIDDTIEGLFTLDYLTGDLQCSVMNTRNIRDRKFFAVFKANVVADLGLETKNPKYLMVSGLANWRGAVGAVRPAMSVVYVVDATSGNFAAYTVPWNTTMAAAGKRQMGSLLLLDKGKARMADIRE